MATTKKTTSKAATAKSTKATAAKKPAVKTATVKKPAAKKAVVKSAPVKKATSKKSASSRSSSAKTQPMRSFRLSKDNHDFKSMRLTRQTFYWLIIVCCLIFAQLWIIKLQVEVSTLIDAQQTQIRNF